MRVRRAEPGDLDALAALAGQLGYPSTPDEASSRLRLLTAHPDLHAVYVAEVGDAVAGWVHVFVGARLESDPFAEIGGLVVDERHRGAGVGEALVREAERWARGRGMAQLRVRSNVVRKRAHRFYEREGFERLKEQVVFQKRLA
ncbi:MAG TPA: GNAT family N-acetyltransferase [Rubricoccaceae bacterium]|nr:GNAT family N-acetyltransferase [Rubricoccaceae bacterium]